MEFDVIVLGGGIAGNVTAYYLCQAGFNVAQITKGEQLNETNTYYAQGGISYQGKEDSWQLRYDDIMRAGDGICNPKAVEIVAKDGPSLIEKVLINDFKVDFSRAENSQFDLAEEGAHSVKRIIHYYDITGRRIQEASVEALSKQSNLTILKNCTALDIITWHHHSTDKLRMYVPPTALGLYFLNNRTREVKKILAKAIVLATGGMGQIFLHTTNPRSATGDGFAMASRAGARLINLEFSQFHPTTLYMPKANNFLISEAVRGEGAVITDLNGNPFMHKYHPLKDLAPRDVVTRAILSEMLESGDHYVLLDLSSIGANNIRNRFPYIYQTCLDLGIDITIEPIPIVPAFHFACGGVMTDMYGRTNIQRLFAVGEVACTGLHGANRLASTSLLEALVFGYRVAEFIRQNRDEFMNFEFPDIPEWIDTGIESYVDPALIKQDWTFLQNIMWNYVGPIRTARRLKRAISQLKNLRDEIENFYRNLKLDRRIIELRNAVQIAVLVAEHAWANRQSIGAHYRADSDSEL